MWLALAPKTQRLVKVVNRQSIWPASDDSDAELVIVAEAELTEDVLVSTLQLVRLSYRLTRVDATMKLGSAAPVPWRDAKAASGAGFEIMLTQKGAMLAPGHGQRLPNRVATWLTTFAEDVRAAWPVVPPDVKADTTWSSAPVAPGGLPPGTTHAEVTLRYEALTVTPDAAEIAVAYGMKATLDGPSGPQQAQGAGRVLVTLGKKEGPRKAERQSTLTLSRTGRRNQIVKTSVDVNIVRAT